MIGKKINQLATELAPAATDLTIIGDPTTGVSKKITLEQISSLFGGSVSFYANLAGFPAVGNIDIIYCAKDTKKLYLWSGSAYVEVFPSQALLDTYQLRSEKGNANGYASLDSLGKVPISQLPSSLMEYKGTWNASTNTPTLANGTGDTGDVYICNVAGTVNFGAGPITFAVGDYVIYSGTIWQRSSGAVGTVTSVAVSRSGDALAITGSPVTTSGTINVGFAGNSTQYINGAGNLVTFPGVINEAQNLITEVYNKTGATLTKGTIVYINGGQGNLPTITKALATSDSTSAQTYGIVRNDITNNNNGYVVVAGRISDLDTQAYTEGTQLYLSPTTAGTFTSTKPYAPQHLVYVGIVVRAHPTQGVIEVKIQNGYELDEIHNVAAQSPSNGDILQYVSSTSLWTKVAGTTSNIAEGSNLYYTDARSRAALSFTAGSGAYNSTTGVITIPTNTNQLTNGANYITLGSLSASSPLSYNNGTGAFSISQANTSTNGFLSSTDWNTFNGKQAALNGTGFVKISGTTISYDNSTYYLASNPNAYIPLTALSAGAGISYNNTTGVIASTITQYTDANARAAISLTTTGTSGAATYNSTTGVLNVPQYAPDLSGYVPTSRTLTINGTAYDLSANRSWSVGTVTSVGLSSATSGVTIGSTPITTSGTITLAIATASGSQQGLLSSTDWTTFNNKQNALTNPVTGTGTTNYLPKFTGASTIGNSIVYDDGAVGIGTLNATAINNASGLANLVVGNGGGASQGITIYTNSSTYGGLNFADATSGGGAYAGYIKFDHTNDSMGFFIGNTQRLLLNASGILGLGVTPSVWGADFKAVQIGTSGGSIANDDWNGFTEILNNVYGSARNTYTRIQSLGATRYSQQFGTHAWYSVGAGSGGATVSFTQAMTLNASGNLSIGNTNDTFKLDVTGTLRTTGNITLGNGLSERILSASSYIEMYNASTGDMTLFSGYPGASIKFCTNNSSTPKLTIASTGAATFSSSVTTNATSTFSNASSLSAIFSNGGAVNNYNSIELRGGTAGTSVNWQISKDNTLANGFELAPSTTAGGTTYGSSVFKISSAGAATFSSSVTAQQSKFWDGTQGLFIGAFTGGSGFGAIYPTTVTPSNSNHAFAASSGATVINTGASGIIDLEINTTSALYIANNRNVGIGTTSPNSLLEVNRTITFSSVDTYGQLVVKTTSGANGKLLNIGVDETNSVSFIQSLNRGTDAMPLSLQRYGGNVGIGSVSPIGKLHINATTGVAAPGSIALAIRDASNPVFGFDFNLEGVATGDLYLMRTVSGTQSTVLQIARATGAATFSGTLGINGVSDNIKSGTYTPTLSSIYNVASSTAFVCQYMRVGNVVTVSGVINVTATATNTWTRISMTLPISSNFDFSYRAGGGGGANSTNNVCVILAGASTSVVYLDAYPNSTNSLSYYFSYTYQII